MNASQSKTGKKAAKKTTSAADPASDPDQVARFEDSLNELEQLVNRMEGGELSLDESLASFERGIGLFRSCQGALEQAELRVKLLSDPADPASATDFPAPKKSTGSTTDEFDDEDIPS